MPTPIFTRLHKLAELVDAVDIPTSEHHYVIGPDLMLAMGRDDVQRSIAAMIEADMARLPFPEILVEFSVVPRITRFLWLRERKGMGFEAKTILLNADVMALVPEDAPFVTIQAGELAVRDCEDGHDASAIALGTAFALLMLNIKGVDKTRIDATALNKARVKAGKPEVPTHIVLRIGVVYDRQGRPVRGGGINACYLRPGHSRNQAHGPGWREHRVIYIEPYLVNYRDGDELPSPRARVVKMGKSK